MILLNGQNYETSMVFPFNGYAPVAAAYGGRTCLTINPLSTSSSFAIEIGLVNQIFGKAWATTDTPPMGWHFQLRFAFQALTVADGASVPFFVPTMVVQSDTPGNTTYELSVRRAGSVYTIWAKAVQNGTTYEHAVANVTVGTTFHVLDWWLFRDKFATFWDGDPVDEETYGVDSTALCPYRLSCYNSTAGLDWPFEHLLFIREEYPGTGTLDRSTTNGSPDNGLLYWITEDGLAAEVLAGEAGEITIADGDVDTSSFPASKNLLLTKVLTGNNGGYGEKGVTDGSSNYTKSEWSL